MFSISSSRRLEMPQAVLESVQDGKVKIFRARDLCSVRGGVPTGLPGLDPFLPWGGWPCGALTELCGPSMDFAALVALRSAAACSRRARVAFVLPEGLTLNARFFLAFGGRLSNLYFFSPGRQLVLWVADRLLRSACFCLLVMPVQDPVSGLDFLSRNQDAYEKLRLRLIAQSSARGTALLCPLGPEPGVERGSFLRLALSPQSDSRLLVTMEKARGCQAARTMNMEWQ